MMGNQSMLDREMERLTREIADLFHLDARLYKIQISFIRKDQKPSFQEFHR